MINADVLKRTARFREVNEQVESGKRALDQYIFKDGYTSYFVGDLHSDDASLVEVLSKTDFYHKVVDRQPFRLIFTGDYVDRGHVHLKVLQRLMMLKILFPANIILLRGNHDGGHVMEDGSIKLPYRVPEQDDNDWYFPLYMKRLSEVNSTCSLELLEDYLITFDSFAYIAHVLVGNKHILALHGGLPRPDENEVYEHMDTLADLTDINQTDVLEMPVTHNIMWSDPDRGDGNLRRELKRFQYTEENFDAFCERFGIDLMIRGHETAKDGYREHFDGRCITLFSSGYIEGVEETAYEDISSKVILLKPNGERVYI